MRNARGLKVIPALLVAAISVSAINGPALAAEKMNAEIHDVVIGKLELALQKGRGVDLKPVRARLADLYAERARLRAMEEAERDCTKCTGALSDRRKALNLYKVVLNEAPKEERGSILLQMAHLHELNGDLKEAEKYYDQIATEGPAKHAREIVTEGFIGRAEARFGRGENLNALKDFQEALRYAGRGRKGPVMQRVAWCHLNLGNQEAAVRTLIKILETPELLERETSSGIQFDPTFQDDVLRDLAIFLARGEVARKEVALLDSLTPDRSKREVLKQLAKESERLGQRNAAIIAWDYALKYEDNHEERIEAMARLAQIRFDLGERATAFQSLRAALDLWAAKGCVSDSCPQIQASLRSLIVAWHRLEKDKPSALLLESYLLYVSRFQDDAEMTLWAAELARQQKKYAQAATLYYKAASLAARSKAKNASRLLNAALVGEIEMAELSKDAKTREAAYDHYLELNPKGPLALKVRYLKAHVAYERGDFREASSRFWQFVSSNSCRGKLNTEAARLCTKAADLDLDALVGLKDHAAVQKRATEYARVLPARRAEYLKIARTAVMKQAEAMEPRAALTKLAEGDLRDAGTDERVQFLKVRIAVAEKAQDVKDVRNTTESLLKIKGLKPVDKEFAYGKIAWAAEMTLDFATAYEVSKKMKLAELKPEARAMKLAVFAELAGRNPTPHIQEFLKKSRDRYQNALMRAKLVRWSKTPLKEFKKHEGSLKQYPGIYASLGLDLYAQNGDVAFAKKVLKVRGVKNEPEGRVLAREILIRELNELDTKLAKHRIHTGSDRLVNKTLSERLKLIAQLDDAANRAIASRDWTSQILALSLVSRENRRLYNDLLRLPVPASLKGEQRRVYARTVEANAKGYLSKADQVDKKLNLLWGDGEEQKSLVSDYRYSRREIRPVLGRELRQLAKVAPTAIRKELEEEMQVESDSPLDRKIMAARREAESNPFDPQTLEKLKELEIVKGRETMVAYLDARLMKLKSGAKR